MSKQAKRQLAGSGEALPAGAVGEVKSSLVTTWTNITTSSQFFDATSLPIPIGVWSVTGKMSYLRNGASFSGTTVGDIVVGVSTTSGNSGAGTIEGYSYYDQSNFATVSFGAFSINTGTVIIRSDGVNLYIGGTTLAGTTLYLKGYIGAFTSGTPQYKGALEAVRIA